MEWVGWVRGWGEFVYICVGIDEVVCIARRFVEDAWEGCRGFGICRYTNLISVRSPGNHSTTYSNLVFTRLWPQVKRVKQKTDIFRETSSNALNTSSHSYPIINSMHAPSKLRQPIHPSRRTSYPNPIPIPTPPTHLQHKTPYNL